MAYDPSRASPVVKEPKAQSDITLDALLDEFEVSDPAVRDRVLRLAGVESSGNLNATGPRVNGGMHNGTRARGALQIMPATAKAYPQYDLNDPADATRAGLHYFLDNLNQFGGDLDAATIAHHAGPGTAKKWLREGRAGTVDRATGLSTDDYLLKVTGGKRAKPADKWWEGDPVAPAEAAGNWWESDPVEPAEAPGLLERGWSALKDTFAAPSGEPVDVRPHPGEKAPVAAKPDSVMADYAGEQSAQQTPANAQARAFVQQQYDAHPEKREAMLSRPDWLGDIARQIDAEYQAMNPAESLKPFDQRREAKLARNRAQGMDPATAEMTTASQIIGGEAPVGSIKASDFDFDLKQRYEGANPALRGAVKGYEGYKQGILGFLQAGADLVGADFASGQFRQGAREAAGQAAAIGEGEAGARLFEGAVASLTQQLPLLIGGSIAGGQALILSGMAAQAFGQEYSEGRQAGLNGQDAATRASLFAAFEVIGEKFGLGNQLAALKMAYKGVPTKQLVAELGAALAKEIPGEVLTTTGQFLTDKAPQIGLNPEAGMAQYLSQVADTIGQTIIQGGLMMGGASAVSRGARAMQRPEPDLTAGLQFDPGVNDALARQALDPSNAQETADVAPPLDAASYQGPSADPAGGAGNTPSGPVDLGRVDQPAGAPARSGEPGVSVGEAERQQVAGVVEQKIAEKEVEAAATGDPIELLVTRAEGAALRRAVTPQPANGIDIDQDALLADVEAMFTEGGNLMVQGDNAREAVKRIDPKALASALPRGDGALLVPQRFAGPVMDALQGAKQRVSVAFGGDGMMQAPDVAQFRATVPTQEEVQDVPKAEQVAPQATEARGQEGEAAADGRVTRDRPMNDGATVTDAEGNQYRVHYQRNDLVIAHPIVNGKPQVSADTTVRFWTNLDVAPSGENDRTDPIYPVAQPTEARSSIEGEPASWVIRNKETGEAVMETFDRAKVDALNTKKYEAVPILQHLQEVNRDIKETQAPTAPEQSSPAPAQTQSADKPKRQPPARKPDPVTVDRAQRNAEDLRAMAQDAGWAEEGGKLIRDAEGKASRTKWIPRAEWFMTGMEARPDVLAQHIEAAARGEWIPVKSARTIEGMVEWLDAQRGQATLDEDASMYDFEASFGDVLDVPDAREVAEFFDDAFGDFAEQSEADAMRAMGFTEEEIANAGGQTQAGAGSAEATDARGTAEPGERAGEAGAAQEEAGQGQQELDPLDFTPKQYHEAKLKWAAQEYNLPMSEVREMQDSEADRKASEQQWVNAVKQAFRDGRDLTAKTLDKLEEVRPGAFNSFLHDHPAANVPQGYQTPEARQIEKQRAQERKGDRKAAKEERAKPMLQSNGKPFPSEKLAAESARQRKLDMAPVKVDGGWGLAEKPVRMLNAEGRATDGKPIMPGDTFPTLSGRMTTPYPKQKGEKYASQWLIDNAKSEAESRGDDYNLRMFGAIPLLKGGFLTEADKDMMLMYLFEQQPDVVPGILKPLNASAEPLTLDTYTNADIAQREAEQTARAEDDARAEREAAQREQADRERDSFTLTGSDRAADVAAARGQGDIFAQPQQADAGSGAAESERFGAAAEHDRKAMPSGLSFPSERIVTNVQAAFEPLEVQASSIGTSGGYVNFGSQYPDGRYYIESAGKSIGFIDGKWGDVTPRGLQPRGVYDAGNLQAETIRVLQSQGARLAKDSGRDDPRYSFAGQNARMTDAERRATAPSATADVADSDVIVVFNGTEMLNAPAPANAPKRFTRSALVRSIASRFPSLTSAVESALRRGDEGKAGGVVVVERAEDLARTFAEKTGRSMDDAVQSLGSTDGRDVNGLFDPRSGLTFLVAPNLTAETAPAVLLHEATHGKQRAEIDRKAMDLIETRQARSKPLRDFLFRVEQRMDAAGESGNVTEAAAYIVEEAVVAGRQAGFSAVDGKLMNWIDLKFGRRVSDIVRDFVAMVRAWAMRAGVDLNPTVDDLVAIAKLNVRDMARGDVTGGEGTKESRINFSRAGQAAMSASATAAQPAQAAPRAAQAQAQAPAGFDLPRWTKADTTQERIQDRYNRLRDAVKAVAAQGGVVTDMNNFDWGEDRFHGIASNRIEQLGEKVKAILEDAKASAVSLDEVVLYAYAEHAPERNAAMQAINDKVKTGSGMSDAEAGAIIARAKQEGTDAKLARLADSIRQIARDTLQFQLDSGLITKDEFDAYNAKYQKWVPLRGFETIDEDGRTFRGTGKGFNIRGSENLRALGRDSKAGQIFENIMLDAERAIVRGTKNTEVNHRFLQFIIDNPDQNLWEIDAQKTKQGFKNGRVTLESLVDKGDGTIGVKVKGHVVYMKIHDKKLFEQMANHWNDMEFGAIPYIGAFNRYLSKSYTAWSPEFALYTNPMRDLQAALFSITGREGIGMTARFAKNYPRAVLAAYRGEAMPNIPGVKAAKDPLYEEYKAMGGKTGFWNLSTLESKVKEIETLVKEMESLTIKNSWRVPVKAAKALERLITGHAGALENATRLASYMAMREAGHSKAEAARFAKNLNVNFNRRGTWTAGLGSIFLFFNPAVQGVHNMYETLAHGKHKGQAWALIGAGMAGMAGLAVLNAMAGDDDDGIPYWDKIPQYEKERNIIIVLPPFARGIGQMIPDSKGRYLKIPMPYQWNVPMYASTLAVDVYRNSENAAHGIKPGSAAARLAVSGATSFMPITGLPPTIAPIYQHTANKSGFGDGPLYPETPWNKHKPDSEKYSAAMHDTGWQKWASFVNAATGGSQFKEGLISIPPSVWRNYVRAYLGGPMSFLSGSYDALAEEDITRAPFLRKAYGEIGFRQDQSKFYEVADQAVPTYKAYMDALKADPKAAKAMRESSAIMIDVGRATEMYMNQLGATYKQDKRTKDNARMTEAEKRMQLKITEQKRSDIHERYLKMWREKVEKAAAQ